MSLRIIPPALLAAAALTAGPVARAQPNDDVERGHHDAAREHYDAGRFQEAGAEFEAAYAIRAHPAHLYNAYVAYRDGDRVEDALRLLRAYLEAAPDDPNRERLEAQASLLEERLGDGEPPETESAAPVAAPASPELTAPQVAPYEGADADGSVHWSGPAALGVGGVLLLSSAITGALALDAEAELVDGCPDKMCREDLSDVESRGRALATATDVLWITGSVVAVGGLLLLLLVEEPSPEAASLGLGCTREGCMATTGGAF